MRLKKRLESLEKCFTLQRDRINAICAHFGIETVLKVNVICDYLETETILLSEEEMVPPSRYKVIKKGEET